MTIWFCANELLYQFRNSASSIAEVGVLLYGEPDIATLVQSSGNTLNGSTTSEIRVSLIGANSAPMVEAESPQSFKSNFFIGNDPSRWRSNVTAYGAIVYRNVYDGIDLKYYFNNGELEYDFIVSPGYTPHQIEIRYEGVDGELLLSHQAEEGYLCRNADGSGSVNISDAVYLVGYIFGGAEPNPPAAGDSDCSGSINISDAVYLIAYIFGGGPEPCNACP